MKRTTKANKYISNLEEIISELGEMREGLQETFDSKSEKWQEGDKGEEMNENISSLEDIINGLESTLQDMENLFEAD